MSLLPFGEAVFGDFDAKRVDDSGEICEEGVADMASMMPAIGAWIIQSADLMSWTSVPDPNTCYVHSRILR